MGEGAGINETLARVQRLTAAGEVLISRHGYEELAADGIFASDAMAGVGSAILVEDYPLHPRGPCVLVLQADADGRPIHVVWGIPARRSGPAVLMTAYRPDAARWSIDFRTRKTP
ncbi:MAG: DUF4258 domain-containing protein [Variibacter sp.]|nr:DUF4258 domain-containing protein [Variibacter sp.]